MTLPQRPQHNSLDWLVSNFARDVPGVSHAVLVSVDGLLIAANEQLPRDRAEQLAAVTSGLASLAAGGPHSSSRQVRYCNQSSRWPGGLSVGDACG